jgi:alpha 1,3-glucosidase
MDPRSSSAGLSWHRLGLVALSFTLLVSTLAVKRHDFKTCDQSGFCKRNRAFADRSQHDGWLSPYALSAPTFEGGKLSAQIANEVYPSIKFRLDVTFQADGVARVQMDEVDGLRQRYNEAPKWTLEPSTQPKTLTDSSDFNPTFDPNQTRIKYNSGRYELVIDHSPIKLTFLRDGAPHVVVNERGLLNMEHFRLKPVGEGDEGVAEKVTHDKYPHFVADEEIGEWEESFGGKKDSKPKGEWRRCDGRA